MSGERISLGMNAFDAAVAIAGGNIGAVSVCGKLIATAKSIDPDNALGAFGPLILMDSFGIYEEKIWMLFSDVCGVDAEKTIGLLRSCQLGHITRSELNYAIENQGRGLDVEKLVSDVKKELPNFGNTEKASEPFDTED